VRAFTDSRSFDRLGWVGLAGLALLVAAIVFAVSIVLPMRDRLHELRTTADAIQKRLSSATSIAAEPAAGPERLAAFHAFFPRLDTSADWLARIHRAATRHKLEFASGDYRLERRGEDRIIRYQVSLPVAGTYTDIRLFIAAVLADVPAAALDDVVMRRESLADPRIEARVRFTLHFIGGAES